MTHFSKICATIVLALSASSAFAGGILTNTNQSISFLRNPAQEGAINLNGVYSNPAGVAFLGEGFHIGLNWQGVKQTREITSVNPLFATGAKHPGETSILFKGDAMAPVVPSIQAAYNTGDWSFQFNFAVTGGGGKCTFDNGLGSFEGAVAGIAYQLGGVSQQLQAAGINVPTINGYSADSYLQGKQYFFGFTLGAAYKINDNLSVYGGARAVYGTAAYKVNIENIKAMAGAQGYTLPELFQNVESALTAKGEELAALGAQVQGGIQQYVAGYMAAGMTQEQAMAMPEVQALLGQAQQIQQGAQTLEATGQQLNASAEQLAPYSNGVKLQCDQSTFGIAPIIGVDYKIGNFNFGAKYEFMTRLRLKNSSTVKEASLIDAVNKFQDGKKVAEDMPAMLAVGAQWSVLPNVRINAGYHLYQDKDAKKYGDAQKKLAGNSFEYLGGAEWDFAKKWTVSAGFQTTNYGLSDDYMNDMSFVVDSWSFGLGVKYQVSEKVAINAAYFQTNYENYKSQKADAYGTTNNYTRTNKVLGVGVELDI